MLDDRGNEGGCLTGRYYLQFPTQVCFSPWSAMPDAGMAEHDGHAMPAFSSCRAPFPPKI